MTTQSSELSREAASRDLLAALMSVKSWMRETNKWLYASHSPASLMTLALLDRTGSCRVSDLAELARVDVSVVSRQMSHLEQQGYVERTPDPADGRSHRVNLTPDGRNILQDGHERLVEVVGQRLQHWTADDMAAFSARLEQLLVDISE